VGYLGQGLVAGVDREAVVVVEVSCLSLDHKDLGLAQTAPRNDGSRRLVRGQSALECIPGK